MDLLFSFNRGVWYLLRVIDVFTKYTGVKRFTDKKAEPDVHSFIKVVSKSKRKPNKLRVDQGRKFYNELM